MFKSVKLIKISVYTLLPHNYAMHILCFTLTRSVGVETHLDEYDMEIKVVIYVQKTTKFIITKKLKIIGRITLTILNNYFQ